MLIPLRRPGNAGHDILYTGDGHAVAQGLIAGGVRGAGQVCPAGRKPLERLTFLWGEPPDEEGRRYVMAWLVDQVCGVLPLAGALGGGGIVLPEFVHPLAAENGMPVRTGQCIGHILLDANAIAAVAGLPVDGVAADAHDRLRLEGQRQVVSAGARPGGEGGAHRVRPCVPAVHAVVLKNQGLVPVLLRPHKLHIAHFCASAKSSLIPLLVLSPKCCTAFWGPHWGTGLIFRAVHDAAALVVEAEHGGHAVAALACLQCGGNTLRVPNTARAGPRSGGKPSRKAWCPRKAALILTGQPSLHQQGRMELGREGTAPLLRPTQNAQAGSPGQIVFSGRIVLQNQRQGTPCVSAGGCRASIELMCRTGL